MVERRGTYPNQHIGGDTQLWLGQIVAEDDVLEAAVRSEGERLQIVVSDWDIFGLTVISSAVRRTALEPTGLQ